VHDVGPIIGTPKGRQLQEWKKKPRGIPRGRKPIRDYVECHLPLSAVKRKTHTSAKVRGWPPSQAHRGYRGRDERINKGVSGMKTSIVGEYKLLAWDS